MTQNNVGVLLTNIGTPDHPTPSAVRRFLKEFLKDPHVVKIPRIIWWPILHTVVLPFRAKQSARLYQSIWTEHGSPLLHHSKQLTAALQKKLQLPVELGMHYGKPSIQHALENLKEKNVRKILVLPLYPQYSSTTTASAYSAVKRALKKWRIKPEIRVITDYADDPLYIRALAESIREAQIDHKPERIIFSFHGIPEQFVRSGDPYQKRCEKTVTLLAEELELDASDYALTFQSRLGRAKWLEPYTDHALQIFPKKGVTDIQVICPCFAVYCLETLEEIAIRGKEQFLHHGGKVFRYIHALNDKEHHVRLLAGLVQKQILQSCD